MKRFVCEECNYRFGSDSKSVLKKCPYCEKMAIIEEPTAQDLVDE